jgi:hypothetical protein
MLVEGYIGNLNLKVTNINMDVKSYTLFIYGTFEDHDEVEFFCMKVLAELDAVKTLRYVIESNNSIIVIFDSDYDGINLSTELLSVMVNDTIKFYLLYPLDTLITAHLPQKLKDFIFKPKEGEMNIKIEYIKPKNFDLDEVLEKIEKSGIESLTDDEKNFLDNFEM